MNKEDLLSPIFYNRETKDYGRYKVLSVGEKTCMVRFENTSHIDEFLIEDVLKDDIVDRTSKKIRKSKKAKKHNIEVKVIIDSREQITKWLDEFEFDNKYKSDKIMISSYETKCFKADGASISTGDIGIEIRLEGEKEWKKTKLSIERKLGSDIFGTLFMSENVKRFHKEIDRGEEYGLQMYFLHDWDFIDVDNHIKRLQKLGKVGKKTRPDIVFRDNYINVSKRMACICCGGDFSGTIRRIIKNYIQSERLQYK